MDPNIELFWKIISPILLLFGLGGNITAVIIINRKPFKETNTNAHVKLLAIADSASLLTGLLPQWLACLDINILKNFIVTCLIKDGLFHSFSNTSVWFILLYSLDRFFAICHPHKVTIFSKKKNVWIIALIIFILILIYSNILVWTEYLIFDSDKPQNFTNIACQFSINNSERYYFLGNNLLFIVAMIVIPFITLITLNSFITFICCKNDKRMKKKRYNSRKGGVKQQKPCIACVIVSSFFIMTHLPTLIVLLMNPYNRIYQNYDIIFAVAEAFMYLNNVLNIYLYSLFGERFRSELKKAMMSVFGLMRNIRLKNTVECSISERSSSAKLSIISVNPCSIRVSRVF